MAKSYAELLSEYKQTQAKPAPLAGGSSTGTSNKKSYKELVDEFRGGSSKPSSQPIPATTPPLEAPKPPQFSGTSGGYLDSIRTPAEDLSFSSRTSTQVVPTAEQTRAAQDVISPIVTTGRAIATKAKELRQSKDAGTRVVGALADSAIETGKSLAQKLDATAPKRMPNGEFRTSGLAMVDFGLNFVTLGITDFVPDAIPELAGFAGKGAGLAARAIPGVGKFVDPEKVAKATQSGVRQGIDFLFGKVLYEGVGGAAVKGYEAAFGELDEADKEAIKSIATIGTMIAGFKGAGKAIEAKGKRAANISSANDLVAPMAESLGMNVKYDGNGNAIIPSQEAIAAAHKKALMQAADQGGPFMYAKMDAFDTARQLLVDYKTQGPEGFAQKWQPVFESGSRLADEVTTRAEVKTEEARLTTDAQKVNAILNEPATPKTRKLKQDLSQEAQFAFEQELVDMNANNDPKLSNKAQGEGYTYERTSIPFDERPAFYDALTNKITLNEDAIRTTLDKVWEGNVLRVGEGKTTTVFRKKPGETFEQMKTRYEQTLVDHEMAHAKTIAPEDVARLRAAVGDEGKLNKIRKELEDRANEYSFRKASDLDEGTERAVDYTIERVQRGLNLKENLDNLRYQSTEREAAYSRWKNIVRRSPDYARADWDQLEGGLKKSPAYKNKSVKGLFENALDRDAVSGKSSIDSFDRLLEEFQSRYKTERTYIDEYKQARAAQQKLIPDVKKNPAVERAVKREMQAEMRAQKLEGKGRKLEMRLLRERITRRLEKEVLREKSIEAERRLRSKITDKKAAQQDLVNFMREAGVPNEVRGKFLSALKEAKNDADVRAIVDEIKTEYNKYERREKRATITELLKSTKVKRDVSGKSIGKFTAEVQKKLNDIRNYAKRDRNSLNQEIIRLVDLSREKMMQEGNMSLDLPDDVASKIELLELGGLQDQSLTQLKRTEAIVRELIEKGKTDRKADVKLKKDRVLRLADAALERLTGSPKPKLMTQRSLDKLKKDGFARKFYNAGSIIDDMGREMGGVFENAGRELSNRVYRAEEKLLIEKETLESKMVSLYGKKWQEQMMLMVNEQKDFGVMKNSIGQDVEVRTTRAQAMDLYMRLKESGSKEFITQAEKFTDKDGTERVAGLGYTDDITGNILSVLSSEDKALADWIVKDGYAKWWKELSPVYEKRTGIPLGQVENFAGTRKFDNAIASGDDIAVGFVQDIMDSSLSKRLSTTPGFVKSRVLQHGNIRLSNNPILDYLTYSKRAAHYIEAGDVINEWRTIMSNKNIRLAIEEKYGASFLQALQSAVDNATRGGYDMGGRESGYAKFMDGVAGNVATALLTSPGVWAGQLSSPFGFRAEMSILPGSQSDWWKGFADAKNLHEDMMKYSSAYKVRLTATPYELLQTFSGEKSKVIRYMDWFKRLQGKPLEKADAVATRRGAAGIFLAQKNFYLKQGFDLEKAKTLAGSDLNSVITRTQSTKHYIGKSQMETGGLRYLVQLRQQPMKIARGGIEAFKLFKQKRINSKQLASYLVWNYGVQVAAYVALKEAVSIATDLSAQAGYDIFGYKDDAEKREEDVKKKLDPKMFGKKVAVNSVTSLISYPIVGDIISTLIQNFSQGTNYEFRPTLFDTLADDIFAAGKQWKNGDVDESAILGIRAVTRSAGIGDPAGLIKWILPVLSRKNTERKAEERQTPEAKIKAIQKRQENIMKKAQKMR